MRQILHFFVTPPPGLVPNLKLIQGFAVGEDHVVMTRNGGGLKIFNRDVNGEWLENSIDAQTAGRFEIVKSDLLVYGDVTSNGNTLRYDLNSGYLVQSIPPPENSDCMVSPSQVIEVIEEDLVAIVSVCNGTGNTNALAGLYERTISGDYVLQFVHETSHYNNSRNSLMRVILTTDALLLTVRNYNRSSKMPSLKNYMFSVNSTPVFLATLCFLSLTY